MELKQKKEILTWILDFIQTDFDSLMGEKKALTVRNLTWFVFGYYDTPDTGWDKPLLSEYIAAAIMQTEPSVKLMKALKSIEENVKRTQNNLRKFIDDVLKVNPKNRIALPKITATLTLEEYSEPKWYMTPRKTIAVDLPFKKKVLYAMKFHPVSGSPDDLAVINLAMILNDLPPDSIRSCKECHRYFVNLTAKNKQYCSTKCIWRNASRKRMERIKADPEEYDRYKSQQAIIMKKRYKAKIIGTPIGKVKIPKKKA